MIRELAFKKKRSLYESSSDISPNWEDIRTNFGYTMLSKIGKHRGYKNMNSVCQLCAPFSRLPFGSDNMLISGFAFGCAQILHGTSDMSVTVRRNAR